ncbi:enoyl-CoA hydratase/isomerase family protein [Herbaspirillum sp. WKF16]|jgi:enoyl-CoA hydratase/carnithine racemase|uniref:enoyl-CoA hydratase/isomerase family protein n=1 Tax=Herbaspirillum sp. WKF16 TaxID=3028312 RepID=UPI0023AA148E|nr:enoyl-CoA hydratase/isomerase family protein [Herbaspirillum sp. WKF16]WDZ95598.1 enoyl-CoA hydratase/isomerase family protein [Herbaspirillum sp. WKF16]
MSALVVREDRNGLCTLTLNRPEKMNALTVQMFLELHEHVTALEQQGETVGAVLLRGAGRCFSAGNDLRDLAAGQPLPVPHLQARTIDRLARLPQPVIVAVHGHCYTGALELALAGDLIVASHSARFADTHAKWALTPLWGMSQRLPRRVGAARAKEIMLLGRTYTGVQAAELGLANFCYSDEAFEAQVEALARELLAGSWFSHRANKRLLLETDGLPLEAGLAHEVFRNAGKGPDMQERIAAFGKK